MIGFLFGFGAAAAAVTAEYLYKRPEIIAEPWINNVHLWLPLQLWIGYCVFRLVNLPGTNLLDAFIVFAFCTAVLRIVLTTAVLHQSVPVQSWVGFGLVLAATCVKTFWKGDY